MTTQGLFVRDAGKAFGDRVLWSGLTFDVPTGSMLALTGASGSGKTTLLNCLGLLDDLDEGSIALEGVTISGASGRRRRRYRRRDLGYLFQNYALIDNATVRENLDVAVGRATWRRRRMPGVYEECLDQVGLGGRGDDLVFRLSGGEQQRVAVARLMLKRPRLVLADEPTGALDDANAADVLGFLEGVAASGCVVIIATHSADVAARCDLRLNLASCG